MAFTFRGLSIGGKKSQFQLDKIQLEKDKFELAKGLHQIRALDKAGKDVIKQIIQETKTQSVKDIEDLVDARDRALDVDDPDREDLMLVYDDVAEDGHVSGILSAIKNKIKAKQPIVVDSSGEEDEEATKLIQKQWFTIFIDLVVEARFYGYSIIQLGDIVDDGFPNMQVVPRENCVPEKKAIYKTAGDTESTSFKWDAPGLAQWLIPIGSNALGLFNKAAPHTIAKRVMFSSSWQYAELFGQPIRVGTTDIEDPARKANMVQFLESMGSAPWIVKHDEDVVDFVESGKSGAVDVFIRPIQLSNTEISKAFAGSGSVFDEKAFVGSAEVQERLFQEFVMSFLRDVTFACNDELLPRMREHGITTIKEGAKVMFPMEQTTTPTEAAEIIASLSNTYTFAPETVTKATGIKVEPQEEGVATNLLNGAQVASMVQVVESVAMGIMPKESAIQIMISSFGLDKATAESMINPIDVQEADSFTEEPVPEAVAKLYKPKIDG